MRQLLASISIKIDYRKCPVVVCQASLDRWERRLHETALKFDRGTQQVKVLSRQRLASRREASLAPRWGDSSGEA
jgi:hypothetical protein